jgi:RNA polymerase sigma factor (sigma-70 family)
LRERFLGFLIGHVDKYYGAWSLSFEDKLSIATLGLIDAALKFDLNRSTRLTTFARWRIKARFSEAHEHDGLIGGKIVKRGRKQRREDAEAVGSNLVGGSVWISFGDVYLDAPIGKDDDEDDDSYDGHDVHGDGGKWAERIDKQLDQIARIAELNRAQKILTRRERAIFRARFADKKTQQEIADEFGVKPQRIGQIENRLLHKLAAEIATYHSRHSPDYFPCPGFGARPTQVPIADYWEIVRRLHNQWPKWPERIQPTACCSTPRLAMMCASDREQFRRDAKERHAPDVLHRHRPAGVVWCTRIQETPSRFRHA